MNKLAALGFSLFPSNALGFLSLSSPEERAGERRSFHFAVHGEGFFAGAIGFTVWPAAVAASPRRLCESTCTSPV